MVNCGVAAGKVMTDASDIIIDFGGLIRCVPAPDTVLSCDAVCDVSSESISGGLVGTVAQSTPTKIADYSEHGTVSGNSAAGLMNRAFAVERSFATGEGNGEKKR